MVTAGDTNFRMKYANTVLKYEQISFLPKVPGPPAGVKAVVARPGTVIVSWLPPDTTNGRLQSYQVTVRGRDIKVRNGRMGNYISMREGRLSVEK